MNDGQELQVNKGIGIASFVISLVVLICIFLAFVVGGVVKNSGAATPLFNTLLGSVTIFFWLLSGVGVALGIVGCMGKNAKKTLPVLGIVINAFVLVMSVLLMLVGLYMVRQG